MDFEYNPHKIGEIRLLQLLPSKSRSSSHARSTEAEDIHYILHHISLEQAAAYQYSTLSYTWGDPNDRRSVLMENHGNATQPRLLKIRANLASALRVFREHLQEPWYYADVELQSRMFWIDAVCINEADKHERSQQIMLMRMIYQRANQLLIWLGEEYENSNEAMSIVSIIAKRKIPDPHRFRTFLEAYTSSLFFYKAWPYVVKLASRPWSSRTWIMQEYVSSYSSSTLIYCGHEMVTSAEWDGTEVNLNSFQLSVTTNFNRLLEFTEERDNQSMVGFSVPGDEVKERLQQIWLDCMGHWYNLEVVKMDSEEHRRSLLTWVRSARSTVATDPRDKIYACFGYLPHHTRGSLELPSGFHDCDMDILINDYDAPIHDVYASFVRAVVTTSKKLNILSDCFRRSSLVHSSWIPNWTRPEIISIFEANSKGHLRAGTLLVIPLRLHSLQMIGEFEFKN